MKQLLILALIFCCLACDKDKFCKDQELAFDRRDYTGQEIRVDGFWYGPGRTDFEGTVRHSLIVLYGNGVLMLVGSSEESNFEATILRSNTEEVINLDRRTKYIWGAFKVENSSIGLAHWDARPCDYDAILKTGEILNDTSFVLTRMQTKTQSETSTESINEIFHFRAFDQKPDSTNNFIN